MLELLCDVSRHLESKIYLYIYIQKNMISVRKCGKINPNIIITFLRATSTASVV
jgi:hypothetical protein